MTLVPVEDKQAQVREDIKTKNTFQFGHCPKVGGGWRGASLTCGEGGSWEALANQAWRVNHTIVDT